jgi:hypothetical protein
MAPNIMFGTALRPVTRVDEHRRITMERAAQFARLRTILASCRAGRPPEQGD